MRARPDRRIGRVVIVVVGLLVAVNLAIVAGLSQSDDRPGPDRPTAIEALQPEESDVIRPQQQVGVDLRGDLQGMLYVDDTLIPDDQVDGDPNLGILVFQPGSGKEFTELPLGNTSARVEYWPRTYSYEEAKARDSVGSFSWFFKVG